MLETPPTWAIALVFWLHMLATVAWLGGLAAIAILVLPAAKRVLKPVDQLAFIEAIQKRLEPLAWFSLAILIATGLFQLSINPHYDGFLSTSGQWSLAILTGRPDDRCQRDTDLGSAASYPSGFDAY